MTDTPTLAAAEISLAARLLRFGLRMLVCAIAYCCFAGLIYMTVSIGDRLGIPKLGILGLAIDIVVLGGFMLFNQERLGAIGSSLGPVLALLLVILFFAATDVLLHGELASFWTLRNLQSVAAQASPIAVAALGMTLIIIAGGIDLSAGTAVALSATALAWCLNEGHSIAVALLASLACGLLTGALNGTLISLVRVVPFIITLGTMTAYLGCGKFLAGHSTIRPSLEAIPAWVKEMVAPRPETIWLSYPLLPNFASGVWLAIALAFLTAGVLHLTVFGRRVFAIGSNESTARLCGIGVPAAKIAVYALAGAFVGIAGVYQFARVQVGNPESGIGLELKIIAAVVIGGGSLSGGQGSVVGTLCGAAIMLVIASGCTMLGMQNATQDIILGVIIVAAVAVDKFRQRRMGG